VPTDQVCGLWPLNEDRNGDACFARFQAERDPAKVRGIKPYLRSALSLRGKCLGDLSHHRLRRTRLRGRGSGRAASHRDGSTPSVHGTCARKSLFDLFSVYLLLG